MTESHRYPPQLLIEPMVTPIDAVVTVPGSKSITNRAMVLAALTDAVDGVTLVRPLESEDTEVMIASLRQLGFTVTFSDNRESVRITRLASTSPIPATHADLFVANSGTTMRFLTAMVALGTGEYRLDGVPRMRERPIEDLLDALRQLGIDATSETGNGCPPVTIRSMGLRSGEVAIRSGLSSQFLSGLMLAAPFAQGPIRIRVDGTLVSEPYVAMTVAMLRDWGLIIESPSVGVYDISAPQRSTRANYVIEPDASAASYFFAAAAIVGGRVTVTGFPTESLQGDIAFVDLLAQMGCTVMRDETGITLIGGQLRGIDVDMNAISDTVMTLGAVACFAEGPTTIRNVGHIRHKETDRLSALANELRRVGAIVDEREEGLTITPAPLHGAIIETYHDHRMAMSLALVGLRISGVIIDNPACVGKTYPGFWDDLAKLRG